MKVEDAKDIEAVPIDVQGFGRRKDLTVVRDWMCENGHVLGIAVRVRVESEVDGKKIIHFVDRLLKLRHAVDLSAPLRTGPSTESPSTAPKGGSAQGAGGPPEVMEEIDCEIEGTAFDIICDVPGCGSKRTWEMGRTALERLLARVTK